MNARDRKIANLRWLADLTIEAARLQRDRLNEGSPVPRHDLDFYLQSVYRLREIARVASTMRPPVAGTAALVDELDTRFPFVKETRDWWNHPSASLAWTTWFSNVVYRMGAVGEPKQVISSRDSHPDVERFYEALCGCLGPLPELP